MRFGYTQLDGCSRLMRLLCANGTRGVHGANLWLCSNQINRDGCRCGLESMICAQDDGNRFGAVHRCQLDKRVERYRHPLERVSGIHQVSTEEHLGGILCLDHKPDLSVDRLRQTP